MSSTSPSSNPAVGSPLSSSSSPPSQPFSPPPLNSSLRAPPPQLNPFPPVSPRAPAPQLNTSLSDPPSSSVPLLNPRQTATPPQQSPSPSNVTPPPPMPLVSPPPAPPLHTSSPPPQPFNPPPTLSPPQPNPPTISPPPPQPSDPTSSPPPGITNPPPPSLSPPNNVPTPPTTKPPGRSPSPPQPHTGTSPTPPLPKAPNSSPPLPSAKPPLQPPFVPPRYSPTPPVPSPSPPAPFSSSPPGSLRPPLSKMSPPPLSVVSLPPPSPPSPSVAPPHSTSNNISNSNAPKRSQSANDGGIGTGGLVAIVVVLGLLLLSIFGTAVCCVWKRKKRAHRHDDGYIMPTSVGSTLESGNNGSGSGSGIANSPHGSGGLGKSRSWFMYEELLDATNGFSAQNLLGEGGFGSVYKGTLTDGKEVAVKQLKIGGRQGEREFRAEVEIISRVHHRHLVSLVGYCISDDKRLLVYDYLPNNTLYFHLHGEGRPVMDWATRVKIAVGAARGIAYLHEDCHPRIIHRDIKSSNILLDSNFEAQVSDFGLAKLAIDTNSHITTRVMGTFGYMAPEYASSGKLTEKSDVYSFGVVLLELITGRKPVDTSQPIGQESLVEWARPLLSHAIETQVFRQLADPRLDGNYVDGEMFRLIEAAAACVRHSSAKRPKMGQVVRVFDSMATSDLTHGMKLRDSEMFNSVQQSEEIRWFQRMAFGSQNYSTNFLCENENDRTD